MELKEIIKKDFGLTQKKFAEEIRVFENTVNNWCTGKPISLSNIGKIVEYYNCKGIPADNFFKFVSGQFGFTADREFTVYEKYEQPGQPDDLKLFSCSSCGSVHDFTWLIAHNGDVPNYCPSCGKKIATCGDCANFLGGGDWNLCCKNPPKGEIAYQGFLCYEDSNACKNFKARESK